MTPQRCSSRINGGLQNKRALRGGQFITEPTLAKIHGPDLHLHTGLHVVITQRFVQSSEDLGPAFELGHSQHVRNVLFESRWCEHRLGIGQQAPLSGDGKPVHIIAQTLVTIAARREELGSASLAHGPANIVIFQELDKLFRLGVAGETNDSELLESHNSPPWGIPYQAEALGYSFRVHAKRPLPSRCSRTPHRSPIAESIGRGLVDAENGDVAVDSYAADIVNQSDLGLGNLHLTGFTAQLKHDGTNLRTSGGPNGVPL